ncbi:MAG: SRPBCC family protein [bacterium]
MSDRIEKRIVLRAPIDRVWRAISDAPSFGEWFGVDFAGAKFAAGQRVRGNVTNTGYEHLVMNVLVEAIEPPRLLSFRWHPDATDAAADYEHESTTLVVFELQEADGGTLLTLVESGFDALPESRRASAFRGNDAGWDSQMKRVERYVAGTP